MLPAGERERERAMGDESDSEPAPRPTIFGSFIDFVRKDSIPNSKDESVKKNSHLLTWSNGIRQLVSKKKRRHKEDGFDLDLTYITPKLIAMGFPASGNEGIYRNNAAHVTGFLSSKHGDKVKVYNLCSERDYPKELFGGRVSKYPFDDHNPPPMSMFLPYCKDVAAWMDSDPQNVVAIHCKAGKGRTGVMICAYLIYIGEWENPHDCMQFYGFARTNDQKGVTIPSQRRFICYFAELCRNPNESKNSQNVTSPERKESKPDRKVSSFEEVLGVEEEEPAPVTPSRQNDKSKRKKSILGVDLKELKVQMDIAKEELASGDENESDSDEERKMSVVSRTASIVDDHGPDESDISSRPVIHTSNGDFVDYTHDGILKDKLRRASIQAAVTATVPRNGYAQSSLWMTTFHEEVETILIESGQEIPTTENLIAQIEALKLIENVKESESKPPTNLRKRWGDPFREKGEVFRPVPLSINEIRLSSLPKINMMGTFDPYFTIKSAGSTISSVDFLPRHTYRSDGPVILAVPGVVVVDEFLITLYDRSSMTGGKTKLGQFWLHTGFIRDNHVVLTKPEIDKIHKDKKHKKYSSDFTIELSFEEVTFDLEEFSPREDEVIGNI